jgi:hypothetical protein
MVAASFRVYPRPFRKQGPAKRRRQEQTPQEVGVQALSGRDQENLDCVQLMSAV